MLLRGWGVLFVFLAFSDWLFRFGDGDMGFCLGFFCLRFFGLFSLFCFFEGFLMVEDKVSII